jgi:class 3 adenylate cyclase
VGPDIRYAKTSDGVHIAYAVIGDGPPLVFCPPMVWAIEWGFEDPACARFLGRLAEFSRLVLFDKRGTGHSDPILGAPTLEERAADLEAVMDAAMVDRATVFGCSEGGSMALLFAATHPERTSGLITWSTFVRAAGRLEDGVPFIAVPELFPMWAELLEKHWGTGTDAFGGIIPGSPEARSVARRQQLAASPAMARATAEVNAKIDIRPILPAIRVPTLVMHRQGELSIRPEHGRFIAENIDGARYLELPGDHHFPWEGDMDRGIVETQEFVTGVRPEAFIDRVLATVMITDLVDSTDHAARVGDPQWKNVIDRHDRLVRNAIERARGTYLRSTGDGAIATFDGPSRAVRCAKDIVDELERIGLLCRIGLHAGEIELMEDNITGMAVHIAERVTKLAGAKEVLVSSTVRDLAVGSGIHFHDLGEHDLKGVPEPWRIYRAKIA